MSTEDNSTEVSTSEKILELISLAEEAQALINNFYYMELSGEIRRDRVQEGKLKLIELRAAVVSLDEKFFLLLMIRNFFETLIDMM